MPLDLLFSWLMVFFRSLGLVLLLPTLAGRSLPVLMRVAISACLATLLYPLVPTGPMPLDVNQLMLAAGGEVILGLAMGFVGRLVFSGVEMAGRVIANEIGLTAAPGLDAPQPAQEPVAALFSIFAGMLFFLMDGHYGALSAFFKSFELSTAGQPAFGNAGMEVMVTTTGKVIELGLRIAAPFVALNFIVNLGFSVLSRAVPRMNVFIVSYSLRLLLGFALMSTAGGLLARYLWVEFDQLPFRILELLAQR